MQTMVISTDTASKPAPDNADNVVWPVLVRNDVIEGTIRYLAAAMLNALQWLQESRLHYTM